MSKDVPDNEVSELLQSGFRYAMSLVRDKAQAEDLVQEGWLSTIRARGPWNKPYLFSAIRSRFINQWKREQLIPLVSIDDINEPYDPVTEHEQAILENDFDCKELESALSQLRAVEREVLYLTVVEGYTAQEVSDIINAPRNTVLSLSHRARQKVRRHLQKTYAEVAL